MIRVSYTLFILYGIM